MTGKKMILSGLVVTVTLGLGILYAARTALRHSGTETKRPPEQIRGQPLSQLPPEKIPFSPPEKQVYELGWKGIPCARLTIQLDRSDRTAQAYVLSYEGETTNPVIENLWSYRIRGQTRLRPTSLLPVHGQRTSYMNGSRHKRYRISFNRQQKTARTIVRAFTDDERTETTVPFAHGLDLPGAFLMARALAGPPKKKNTLEVVLEDERYAVELRPGKQKQVRVPAGTFRATAYDVRLRGSSETKQERVESARKHRSVRIWIADRHRLPVRMVSNVYVGSVYGKLISVDR